MQSVQEYYLIQLGRSEDVLNKFKESIRKEYFPSKGIGNAKAGVARKIISDFKKISKSNHDLIDLLVFHVEQGVDSTNEYGDIDETFYSSIESSFKSAMELIKKDKLHQDFQSRCLKVVEETDGIGWGFHDCLADLYYSTYENI
ncbi:MAG TPA: hypothetical protein DET40_13570 [Lentisphaeria bacterium]|nr:hypothetical protein [Lentisphaeria bacterium]